MQEINLCGTDKHLLRSFVQECGIVGPLMVYSGCDVKNLLQKEQLKTGKHLWQLTHYERPEIQGLNKQHNSENVKDNLSNRDKEKVKSESTEIHWILKNQQSQLMLKFQIRKVVPLM